MKKRNWVLCCLLTATLLALSSCSCGHKAAELAGMQAPGCITEGYTGDLYCPDCNTVVTFGETVKATGHTPGDRTGATEPDCENEGYTGDILCTTCNEVLEKGETIPALGHTPGQREGAVAATCTAPGATGKVRCVTCGDTLEADEVIAQLPHTPSERMNAKEPTCNELGYTGDILCTVCGQTIEQGENILSLGHVTGKPVNVQEATCQHASYSGDRYCTVCGELWSAGEWGDPSEKLPHTPSGKAENAMPATCQAPGYTGNDTCTVCGEAIPSETLPELEHNFVDNCCTMCGWYVPGFYKDGQLVMGWEELKANGYVTVDNGQLRSLQGNLKGMLVVGEDVTFIRDSSMQLSGLESVWLPESVKTLGSYMLSIPFWTGETQTLKEVFLYCEAYELPSNAFSDCETLEKVVLPDGMTQINHQAFKNCTALKKLHLPAQLETIQSEAFIGAGFEELVLPDHVEKISLRAFSASSLKRIALPASLKEADAELFAYCAQLEEVDLSACTEITELEYGLFRGCVNLKTVKLPPQLKGFAGNYDTFGSGEDMVTLTKLVLPDGFSSLGRERFEALSVETLVWPVSLVDGTNIVGAKGTVGQILYRGTAAQWSMVQGSDQLTHIPITFEYVGD